MRADRFSSDSLDGVTFAAGETDEDRAAAFLKPFGLSAGDSKVFTDRGGEPIALSSAMVDGLDRYASSELEQAARAIVDPREIRLVWKRGLDDREMLTRRYVAEVEGLDVVVDINRAGWRFATSRDGGFKLDRLRAGTVVWAAE